MKKEIIRTENLFKHYLTGKTEVPVIKNLNIEFRSQNPQSTEKQLKQHARSSCAKQLFTSANKKNAPPVTSAFTVYPVPTHSKKH